MTWVLSLLLGVVVILAITALTGYFVAQEFAYMAVDRSRLAARAEAGDTAARRALSVTHRTSFMLSGAQLGITVTGLLVGYVAEPLVGAALGDGLDDLGVPTATGIGIGTVAALVLSTVVQMVFGELFPKNLAIARPEGVSLWLARSTTVYLAAFGWLVRVFDAASNGLLRLLRIEPVHDVEHSATARDLEHIVADSRESGDLPPDLSNLLDRILDFPRQDVGHAMVPRSRVDTVPPDLTVGEVKALMARSHSRFPVVTRDEAVGVVHLTDLLSGDAPNDALVTGVARPPLVLPTAMALPDALRELSTSRNEMACVIDEYGGFAGVLTLEDLAEELVGEITDEHDEPVAQPLVADSDGVWVMAGDVHLDEVERAVGYDLPATEHETIAGLAVATHGSLLDAGESVDIDLPDDPADLATLEPPPDRVLHVRVLEVSRHVPAQVRVSVEERPRRARRGHTHEEHPAPEEAAR